MNQAKVVVEDRKCVAAANKKALELKIEIFYLFNYILHFHLIIFITVNFCTCFYHSFKSTSKI